MDLVIQYLTNIPKFFLIFTTISMTTCFSVCIYQMFWKGVILDKFTTACTLLWKCWKISLGEYYMSLLGFFSYLITSVNVFKHWSPFLFFLQPGSALGQMHSAFVGWKWKSCIFLSGPQGATDTGTGQKYSQGNPHEWLLKMTLCPMTFLYLLLPAKIVSNTFA